MVSRFTFDQPDSLIDSGGPLENLSVHKVRKKRVREFEPGTHQAKRFALSEQAVIAHRRSTKSDVATIQLASPNPILSAGASLSTRIRRHIDRTNTKISSLSWGEKMNYFFPAAIRKKGSPPVRSMEANASLYAKAVSAGLATTSTEFWTKVKASGLDPDEWISRQKASSITSPIVRTIFEKGGASSVEMMAPRLQPKRMEEILLNYLKSQDVKVYSGEKALVQAMQKAGATAQQAEEIISTRRFRVIGGKAMVETPFVGGAGVFIADQDQLRRRWREVFNENLPDVERRKLLVAAHESSEYVLQQVKSRINKVASHRDISIYAADIEFAAKLDDQSVLQQVRRHKIELPGVINQIKKWDDPKRSAAALEYISGLPKTYKEVLSRHGYSPQQVSTLASPIQDIISSHATKPTPDIARPSRRPVIATKGETPKAVGSVVGKQLISKPEALPKSPTQIGFETKYGSYRITPGYSAGVSSFSRWQREGVLPKGSALWALKESNGLPSWKGFYLNHGGEEHVIDFSQSGASRRLQDLEFKVAQGVGDTQVATTIQDDRNLRAAEGRRAALREHQNIGSKTAIDHPTKRRMKQAARKTIDSLKAKKAQGVAEFVLPAKLEDYVSQGVKQAQEHHKLGPLRRTLPYAVGIAVGADVLASRDKTGPFWGLVLGAVGAVAGKRSVGRLGGFAAGYAIGRVGASGVGSLFEQHNGSLAGFGETGEASASRKQLTQFGSGYRGIKKSLDVMAKTLDGLKKKIGFKTAVGGTIPIAPKDSNFVEQWYEIFQVAQAKGETQNALIRAQKERGVWEKLLPTVKQEPYIHKGVQKKANPLMSFSGEDVNSALLEYAREKGIKNVPNFWNQPAVRQTGGPNVIPVNTAAADSVSTAVNKRSGIGVLPTLAHSPEDISPLKTLMAPTLTPEGVRLEKVIHKLHSGNLNVNKFELEKTLSAGGSKPRSINEFAQTIGSPTPAFHKPVDPLAGTVVSRATSKTHIGSAATLSPGQVEHSVAKFQRNYADFAYSSPHGSLMRRGHPKVLEGFQDVGIAETLRLEGTDFGTGWDPARRLAKALFGKAAKEGADKVARGAAFKGILRSDEFQEALAKGTVVKELGAGGVGSVELMETEVGGEIFRYARKQYFSEGARAEQFLAGESEGLRALQGSISPTPYGKGKIAREGREIPVMYFEAIEDAMPAGEAFGMQGGVKKSQSKSLVKAVRELHKKGLYHSDIKPANMLVDKEGRLVLIDPMPDRYKDFGEGVSKRVGQTQDIMAAEIIARGGTPEAIRGRLNILSNSVLIAASGPTPRFAGRYEASLSMAQSIFKRAGATSIAEQYGIPMTPLSSGVSKVPSVGSAKAAVAATGADSPMAKARKADQVTQATRAERKAARAARPKAPAVGSAGVIPSPKSAARFGKMTPSPPNQVLLDLIANAFGEGRDSVARRVAGREKLHNAAAKTAAVNNRNPARRHRSMAQAPSPFIDEDLSTTK